MSLSHHRISLGINALVKVEVLERQRKDGRCAPKQVCDLLYEYLDTRSKSIEDIIINSSPNFFTQFSLELLEDYFKNQLPEKQRRKIESSLLLLGIDLRYRLYLKDLSGDDDKFCVIIDRDQLNHSTENMHDCYTWCTKHEVHFFFSNPCFEFWLLLHLVDVKTEYSSDEQCKILDNEKISNKHTYVSKLLSDHVKRKLGTGQNKRIKHFTEVYLPHIDQAIMRADKFSHTFDEQLMHLGTNIPQLIMLLREPI